VFAYLYLGMLCEFSKKNHVVICLLLHPSSLILSFNFSLLLSLIHSLFRNFRNKFYPSRSSTDRDTGSRNSTILEIFQISFLESYYAIIFFAVNNTPFQCEDRKLMHLPDFPVNLLDCKFDRDHQVPYTSRPAITRLLLILYQPLPIDRIS